MTTPRISDSTVRRLSIYLRLLRELEEDVRDVVSSRELEEDVRDVVSSRELAERTGTTSAQVRKDLSLFGSFGKRGRGYDVPALARALEEILGLDRPWRVGVVGAGKIGTALVGYRDLSRRGFEIVVAFDVDPEKAGRSVFDVPVHAMEELERVIAEEGVEIGIVAVPPEAAQEVADRLAEAGVRGILNFAPVKLRTPEGVRVRSMDVALELEGLTFALTRGREGMRIPGPGRREG